MRPKIIRMKGRGQNESRKKPRSANFATFVTFTAVIPIAYLSRKLRCAKEVNE